MIHFSKVFFLIKSLEYYNRLQPLNHLIQNHLNFLQDYKDLLD